MDKPKNNFRLSIFVFIILLTSCHRQVYNPILTPTTVNSITSMEKPYLILISLDGFRWDYVDKYQPPHLTGFIKNGVKAESLIPSFPSKTFPNHYTIATGLYPDRHGIIGNIFYHPEKQLIYNNRNRDMVEDGSFYGGSPIWIAANNAGMVTASYFFVGTEAPIQGITPTYYYKYDGSIKNEDRVAQVLQWLEMPKEKRPHLVTMYFSDMDTAGHRYGPNNEEVMNRTLMQLDTVLGKLFEGVAKTALPVNIIIVSDHGMQEVSTEKYIPVEKIENDSLYRTINNGSIVNIHLKNKDQVDHIVTALRSNKDHFKVYKTADTPYFEYTPKNKIWGDLQVIPDSGYYFTNFQILNRMKMAKQDAFGQHGFDPEIKDMHGIFYANGPAFKKDHTISSVKNIHIYPLMCRILGLEIPEGIDGSLAPMTDILQSGQ